MIVHWRPRLQNLYQRESRNSGCIQNNR